MAHRQRELSDPPPEKTCVYCGRRIQWRAKWASDWPNVRYCSESCRRHGITPLDTRLEKTILELLAQRATDSSICPSEVARAVGGDDWRDLMEPTRRAARRLVAASEVEMTQHGSVVDPSTAKGPLRIRRRNRHTAVD